MAAHYASIYRPSFSIRTDAHSYDFSINMRECLLSRELQRGKNPQRSILLHTYNSHMQGEDVHVLLNPPSVRIFHSNILHFDGTKIWSSMIFDVTSLPYHYDLFDNPLRVIEVKSP